MSLNGFRDTKGMTWRKGKQGWINGGGKREASGVWHIWLLSKEW